MTMVGAPSRFARARLVTSMTFSSFSLEAFVVLLGAGSSPTVWAGSEGRIGSFEEAVFVRRGNAFAKIRCRQTVLAIEQQRKQETEKERERE